MITEHSGSADIYRAIINPADYKHNHSIRYSGAGKNEKTPLGKARATTEFSAVNAEDLSFTIILDGTGVVEDKKQTSVADQVKMIKHIAYHYNGKEHEPNIVKIIWGKGLNAFYGRLTSLGLDYTLFRPNGEALRAKASLKFVSYDSAYEEAVKAKRSSPDMTHVVTVKAGDTLPLLCQKIYGDVSWYMHVARENNLDGFRNLVPGMELHFPPVR